VKRHLDILCVDDHVDTLKLIEIVLQMEGHEVYTATTASRALELMRERDFNLYVIDVMMPDGNGLELCREIRSHAQHVPIIVHTGKTRPEDRQAAYDAGATLHVAKPAGMEIIVDVADSIRNSMLAYNKASE